MRQGWGCSARRLCLQRTMRARAWRAAPAFPPPRPGSLNSTSAGRWVTAMLCQAQLLSSNCLKCWYLECPHRLAVLCRYLGCVVTAVLSVPGRAWAARTGIDRFQRSSYVLLVDDLAAGCSCLQAVHGLRQQSADPSALSPLGASIAESSMGGEGCLSLAVWLEEVP